MMIECWYCSCLLTSIQVQPSQLQLWKRFLWLIFSQHTSVGNVTVGNGSDECGEKKSRGQKGSNWICLNRPLSTQKQTTASKLNSHKKGVDHNQVMNLCLWSTTLDTPAITNVSSKQRQCFVMYILHKSLCFSIS